MGAISLNVTSCEAGWRGARAGRRPAIKLAPLPWGIVTKTAALSATSVPTHKFLNKTPPRECDRAPAPLGAQDLSPGREPWVGKPSPRLRHPSPRRPAARRPTARSPMDTTLWAAGRAGEGQGERESAFNPRLAPRAKLWRSCGAESFNEPLRQ